VADILVNIDVDDLENGIRFYVQGLGLTLGRHLGAKACELLGGSSPIYLLEKASGTSPYAEARSSRDYRRHWTPVHLDFAVDDLDGAVARALSAGATLEGQIDERSWGRLARMADPFGHGFCLLQFRGRGYDEIDDQRQPTGGS
jgi:predicted enzyme related to lactoylglutathione lyase